jgi:KaiC/GvpD/RAD55 family RecA-like ATPase
MSAPETCIRTRNEIVRLTSGINGLDDSIEGGFPFPSVILVAGSAGTGKTTFAMKYLCEGAKKGEQCLYITTLSEPTQWMMRYAMQFDFMDPAYFDDQIVYMDLGDKLRTMKSEELLNAIDEKIAEVMPQRIVIDPITVIGNMLGGDYRQPTEELERGDLAYGGSEAERALPIGGRLCRRWDHFAPPF